MREVKHYICEMCGTEYNDKKRCEQCEKGHVKTSKIHKARYISFDKNAKSYPISFDVEMENGQIVTYKR